ncbi:MAG: hypothetical protein QW270_03110 [Candidatus Bathyarchaeia archaeon]
MTSLYLAFKPVLIPLAQTRLRTENVNLVNAACFPCDWLFSYDFYTNLTSYWHQPNKETNLSNINYFPKSKVDNHERG